MLKSQFILVVDFLFRGERGLMTTVAGIVLLATMSICVAFAWSGLSRPAKSEPA